ncbi:MAG: hypothetical protein IIV80_03490 [Clostridia bacterium]|nr:hypothetical protein [Clostridia bacterium]MBQ5725199.1 hypothetical protein [Clostridia bacterium]
MRNEPRQRRQSSSRGASDAQDAHPVFGGTCTAVIGSMTQALRAQNLLADAAIRSTVTKISSSETRGGCAYGVDYPCTQAANVRTVLESAGLRVRQYLQG